MNIKLENLQVIIFSRNRHVQLIESLRYWDACGIQTLVLHNTPVPLHSHEIPASTEYIVHEGPIAERCEIASKLLNYEYFIIASDDERYLPTALAKMVMELTNCLNLSSVGGQTVAIMKYGLKYRTNFAYKSQLEYLNLNPEVQKRIKYHYENGKNYSGAMYRVFRQEDFKRFLKLIAKFSEISTPYIFEVTSEIFWTLIGPSKYLDEVFWVRNWIVSPIQTGDWDRKLYFYEWSQNPLYKSEFEFWKQTLTAEFKFLDDYSNFFEIVVNHRMIIEKNEQRKNQEFISPWFAKSKFFLRLIFSAFQSKYREDKLKSQLKFFNVALNNEELETAFSSIVR